MQSTVRTIFHDIVVVAMANVSTVEILSWRCMITAADL